MKTYILVILLGILAVIGWQQANSLSYQIAEKDYQIELKNQDIAHWEEVNDSWVIEYNTVKDVADFWANAYQQAQDRYSELLAHPKPVYYETIVEKQVAVEVPREIRPFQSLDELRGWLDGYEINLYSWGDMRLGEFDCDDFVLYSMIPQAIGDGYLMTSEYLVPAAHMVAATPIGNIMYYIEATPESLYEYKSIRFGYELDEEAK